MKPKHFDFCDWQKAFACFFVEKAKDERVRMVVATHWTSSGYWVEIDPKANEHDRVYQTNKEVQGLLNRFLQARENSRMTDGQYPVSVGGLIL